MTPDTLLWDTGFGCCALSGALRAYVLIRTKGFAGFTTRSSVVIAEYRKLAREGRAPSWPLMASYAFVALGISMMAGVILFGKR